MAKKKDSTTKKIKKLRMTEVEFIAGGLMLVALILFGIMLIGETVVPAELGDTVEVDYYGTLDNGSRFDYGVVNVTIGSGDYLPDFENALIGMISGETKTIKILSEDAYGERSLNNMKIISRVKILEREQEVNLDVLKDSITDGELGVDETLKIRGIYWPVTVMEIDEKNGTAIIRNDPVLNSLYIPIQVGLPWTWKIISITDDEIEISYENIKMGQKIWDGQSSTVLDFTEKNILLDMNHPLAGENLTFELKVLAIEKDFE
ncbi:MAG: FKBP-type peptidyl-prolyl cis-trans isomerase [archaeon]